MLRSPVVADQSRTVATLEPERVEEPPAVHRRPGPGVGTATVHGFGDSGPAALAGGACCAWPLPADATCAGEARRIFRAAAGSLGMPGDLIDDGVTMASELAANTLHARPGGEAGEDGPRPAVGGPELWLYVRRAQGQWELVCKVFDSLRGWRRDAPPMPGRASTDAVTGRGLQVVAGLSDGRWGHHLTRSRLGGWKVPGKAVWFALPVPEPARHVPDWARRAWLGPCDAARELAAMLADRGLGERLMVTNEPVAGIAVLSIQCGLTVWCRDRFTCWRTRAGRYQRQPVADLIESAEQIVSTCEEIDRGVGAGYLGSERVR